MISGRFIYFIVGAFASLIGVANGFAWMLAQDYCDVPLQVGTYIMGIVAARSDDHHLQLVNDVGTPITEKVVGNLDDVEIVFAPTKLPQSMLEVRSDAVEFVDGTCNGKRKLHRGYLKLKHPVSEPVTITVRGGWATSMDYGVKITEDLTFVYDPKHTPKDL